MMKMNAEFTAKERQEFEVNLLIYERCIDEAVKNMTSMEDAFARAFEIIWGKK